jgi:hypothetical protein
MPQKAREERPTRREHRAWRQTLRLRATRTAPTGDAPAADISITGANLQPLEIGPYAYDADGNLTRIGAVQYRYDKVSRLVSAAVP